MAAAVPLLQGAGLMKPHWQALSRCCNRNVMMIALSHDNDGSDNSSGAGSCKHDDCSMRSVVVCHPVSPSYEDSILEPVVTNVMPLTASS